MIIMDPKLYVWKFLIGKRRALKSDPCYDYESCIAIAIAATEQDARDYLKNFAAQNADDARWLEVADVKKLEIAAGPIGWLA